MVRLEGCCETVANQRWPDAPRPSGEGLNLTYSKSTLHRGESGQIASPR